MAALGCLAGAAPAGARIVLDYTSVGTFSEQFFYNNCGISARGSDQMNVNPAAGPGIGVQGGDDSSLDGGETLAFQFTDDLLGQPATATDVSYVASAASGGGSAAISIEAFDSANASLGTQPFSGTSELSISSAFGGAPIQRLVVTANADPVRIEQIAYTPAPGTGISVGWAYGGAYQRDEIDLCGVALTGSNTLYVGGLGAAGGGGVGVVGGIGGGQPNQTIDTGETLTVSLPEAETDVALHLSSNFYLTVDGGAAFDVAALGAQGVSLGTAHVKTDQLDVDVSGLFSDAPIGSFTIESSPGGSDGEQLGSVTFRVPEPDGTASALAAAASMSLVGLAQRRRPR